MAPELMRGQFGKPADIFRYQEGVLSYPVSAFYCVIVWESAYWRWHAIWSYLMVVMHGISFVLASYQKSLHLVSIFDVVLTGYYVSTDLSSELLDILKWMMHPQPQSRYCSYINYMSCD